MILQDSNMIFPCLEKIIFRGKLLKGVICINTLFIEMCLLRSPYLKINFQRRATKITTCGILDFGTKHLSKAATCSIVFFTRGRSVFSATAPLVFSAAVPSVFVFSTRHPWSPCMVGLLGDLITSYARISSSSLSWSSVSVSAAPSLCPRPSPPSLPHSPLVSSLIQGC